MQRMESGLRGLAALLAISIMFAISPYAIANAQEPGTELTQIELTEAHIKGYLNAGQKLAELFDRIDKAGGEPDAKLQAEMDQLAKDNGFKSLEEMELAVSNISFIMSGFGDDNQTYTEPVEALKQELAEIKADNSLKPDEKEQLVRSIEESIKLTPKVKYANNVVLVKKYFPQLIKLFQ